MAINVFNEKVVSLHEAIKLLPNTPARKKLHISTVFRWIQKGLRSKDAAIVRLEIVKIGGKTFTSQEAMQRFFDRLSGDPNVVTPPTETQLQRLKRSQAALEELIRMGL